MRVLVCLLLALLVPASAQASVVRFVPPYTDPPGTEPEESCHRYSQCGPPVLEVAGAPGESNRFEVTADGGGVVVRDRGAALEAGTGCTARDDGSVTCPGAILRVLAGDGDDEVVLGAGVAGSVHGGAGSDLITGADGADTLRGGAGDDKVRGGAGQDVLRGGAGRDVIRARDGQRDFVGCGGGRDRLRGDEQDRHRRCERVALAQRR